MEILKIYPGQVNVRNIDTAVRVLSEGGIVIYPTDTLYALGCDALNQRAIEQLCRIKGLNPDKNLLSIVCGDIAMASEYTRIDNVAFKLLKRYSPGPVTFILPASLHLPKIFKGRKTVGVRIPDNEVARALADALGHPVLTSSVDIDDTDELANPEAVAMHYDHKAKLLIDGGEGGVVPSTIVDITDSASPEIVREGALAVDI